MKCPWLGGRSLVRWTNDFVRPSLIMHRKCLEDASAYSLKNLANILQFKIYPCIPESITELRDQGRAAYQSFHQAFVLDQVMRQSGQDPQQVKFRDILLRLRDAKVTKADWECLMNQTPINVQDQQLSSQRQTK